MRPTQPRTHQFKARFTEEERQACVQWFERHMDRLPQTMVIDDSMKTDDLPKTVRHLMTFASKERLGAGSIYSGMFAVLLTIQHNLQQLPDFQD